MAGGCLFSTLEIVFMYLLPFYTFFPPRRPERPIEEGRIKSVYSKRRNYRTFQATRVNEEDLEQERQRIIFYVS